MKPAELAVALDISTRQVQRLTAAGLPYTPTGAAGKSYDLQECKAWLRENAGCLSTRQKTVATKSTSVFAGNAFTDACRKVQLRTTPSSSRPRSAQHSGEAPPLSLVTHR